VPDAEKDGQEHERQRARLQGFEVHARFTPPS
jgi:hypothetical protein